MSESREKACFCYAERIRTNKIMTKQEKYAALLPSVNFMHLIAKMPVSGMNKSHIKITYCKGAK